MPGREDGASADEESSQCSSGCQSGWTLYLEHSGSGQQQRRTLPYVQPGDVLRQMLPQVEYSDEEEEDSMVSDASSGLPPHLRGEEEELLQVRGQTNMPSQQRRSAFGGDQCHSGWGGSRRTASLSGSRSFVSTRSRSSGEMRSRKKRRAVVQRQDEPATRRHGVFDDDDDLHDTASSSGVVAPAAVVEAIKDGMDLQPSCACAFSVRSTGMQGLAMLHHN
ncbi:hypothetical protein TRIUR3_35332 [Triticum urartu]|uniref:Uncharacterized protein n=1 Tax=Triticum urartu TaxID=4572 RepID=M7Z1Z7_TRIUA|nr:protein SOB FIVE-LIKE 1-like [Triticum urartu]EMS53491.1 hypothetical protein TRIUR3_35332 [Triticum urartu]